MQLTKQNPAVHGGSIKLNFKSPAPNTGSRLNERVVRALDALPDGDIYDTRGVVGMVGGRRKIDHCTVDFHRAEYAVKMAGKLWWGNKATVAALKKKYEL